MGVVEDDNIIDPEVQFILQGGSEQIELLLEKVRGNIERAFQESPNFPLSPNAKQQLPKPTFTVDYSTKTIKDLLHYANTRDPTVQVKAINELISRWTNNKENEKKGESNNSNSKNEANETIVFQIKAEGGLRTLTNLAVDNKDSLDASVVACQAKLTKLFSLLTESSTVRDQIKQTGAVPSFLQMLAAWSSDVSLKKELIINGLATVANLCLDETHATVVRKLGGIPTIVNLVVTQNDQDVKSKALQSLIMLSASSVKNQETIVTESLLEYLFQELRSSPQSPLAKDFLQLLLNLSTCAKTRAIATPKNVLSLLTNLRISDVYPKVETYEIRRYYRNADVPCDGMENNEISLRQATVFVRNCYQLYAKRQTLAAAGSWHLLIFSYLIPVYNIPFDMFKWNFTLVAHAMKLTQNIILEDSMKSVFVAKEGYQLAVKFLSNSDIFPPNILLASAELISALGNRSAGGEKLQMKFGTEGIAPLLLLFSIFPSNERLQLLVARTINSLAVEERNRMAVFQEGGLQALNTLITSEIDEVASQACEAFSHLSHDKFVRRVIRVMGTVVPILVRLLSKPKVSLQCSCIIVLYNLTLEEEGLESISDLKNGATPALLTPLIQSSEPVVQADALKILAVGVKKEAYLSKFLEVQGLPPVLEVLLSPHVDVQVGAMLLLAQLALNGDCRENLKRLGLIEKLKAFAKHPNVVQPNSELVEPMRNLIMKLKAPPAANTSSTSLVKTMFFQCTFNGEVKLLRVPSTVTLNRFIKIIQEQFGIPEHMIVSTQYTGKLGMLRISSDADLESLIAKLSTSETHQFLIFAADIERTLTPPTLLKREDSAALLQSWRSTQSTEKSAPVPLSPAPVRPPGVSQEVISLLGQLDEVQLRSLVVELVRRDPKLKVIEAIKTILTNEEEVELQLSSPVTSATSSPVLPPKSSSITSKSSPSLLMPPPPPPPSLSSSSSSLSSISPLSPRDPNVKPPPATFRLKRKAQPNKYTQEQMRKEKEAPSYGSVLKELSDAVTTQGLKLRHVDMDAEKEKRRKEKQNQNTNSILREIEQVSQLREANREKTKKRIFLDQSVVTGMSIWRSDLRKWNQELQSHFDLSNKFMLLLFKLAEMREDELAFSDAVQVTGASSSGGKVTQERLVEFLLRAGFSVKKNRFQEFGTEKVEEEYKTIIRPTSLPVRYILRSMLLALPGAK